MKQDTIQKTKVYLEMNRDKAEEWFHFTGAKFITHIDTFYYSVKTVGEWGLSLGSSALIAALLLAKQKAISVKEEQPIMEDIYPGLCIKPRFGFHMYKYGITKEGCFDIFVASSVPNPDTSGIVVQLRSQFIWLKGLKAAFEESRDCLMAIMQKYDIIVADITENRIDFAYHTNYIQNMLAFFKIENLGKMAVHSFKRGGLEWAFKDGGEELDADYLSLGRRKSNNAFVRIYNKSKEVIELGYKQFFVPIWQDNGLISRFDRYLFDKIFDEGKQSWNYKESARCMFYLEHGADEELKLEIKALLDNPYTSVTELKKIADSCVPDLTNIVNIEIQIKRNFTRDLVFPKMEYPEKLPLYERRMYKVLHMLQSIRDFITTDTIRFVNYKGEFAKVRRERRPTANWWLRLAACKELDGIHYDICREYQMNYDKRRCKTRTLSQLAAFATLFGPWWEEEDEFSFDTDITDMLCYLNDNDIEKYMGLRGRKLRDIRNKHGKGKGQK